MLCHLNEQGYRHPYYKIALGFAPGSCDLIPVIQQLLLQVTDHPASDLMFYNTM